MGGPKSQYSCDVLIFLVSLAAGLAGRLERSPPAQAAP
jgi:hypothetical protein